METYLVKMRDSKGMLIEERITDESKAIIIMKIQDRNLYLIDIKKETKPFLNLRKVSVKELALFFSQLSYVISNGMTLHKGLMIIRNQIKNKEFKKVIDNTIRDVESGFSLSRAFEKNSDIFNDSIIFQVKSAEEGGFIEETLKRISESLEKEASFKSKVKGAMLYPCFVVVAMVGVLYFLLTFIIPALGETLSNFDAELPALTVALMYISEFVQENIGYILLSIAIVISIFIYVLRIHKVKKVVDKGLLKLPIVGKFVKYSNIVSFSRNLSALLNGGVQLNRAMDNLINVSRNEVVRECLLNTRHYIVNEGSTLSNALGKDDFFPESFMQIINVGEESGNLPGMLDSLSEQYEEDLNMLLKNTIELVNPILMVIIAVMVGVVVLAMFLPVFSLMDQF